MITNELLILGLFCVCASIALWLDKHTEVGKKICAVNIALIIGVLLVNLNVVPSWSDTHGLTFSHVAPLAIALYLFNADIRQFLKLGPRLIGTYVVCTVGIIVGAFVAAFIFNIGPETYKVFGMFTATYIGGSSNLAATGEALKVSKELYAPICAADVVLFFIWVLILTNIPKIKWIRSKFITLDSKKHDVKELKLDNTELDGQSSAELLPDVSIALGVSTGVYSISQYLGILTGMIPILIITVIMIVLASTTKIGNNRVAQPFGSYLFAFFMVAIGAMTPIKSVIEAGVPIFAGGAVLLSVHGIVALTLGKIFKLPLEHILIASNAHVGGHVTAAPQAWALGLPEMVLPAILWGVMGNVTGTFLGVGVAMAIKSML